MKILVTGKNGQLGKSIHKVVTSKKIPYEFIFVGRQELDLSNIDSIKGLAESMLLNIDINTSIDNKIINLFEKILREEENYPLALWVIAEHEIKLNNYDKAKVLLNRLLIQLSEDTEEYNLVLNKLKEISK